MPTISLCMIVKNEEKHIARCLDSVAQLVDEIIIVDTGSVDRTIEIVSNYHTNIQLKRQRQRQRLSYKEKLLEGCLAWICFFFQVAGMRT